MRKIEVYSHMPLTGTHSTPSVRVLEWVELVFIHHLRLRQERGFEFLGAVGKLQESEQGKQVGPPLPV